MRGFKPIMKLLGKSRSVETCHEAVSGLRTDYDFCNAVTITQLLMISTIGERL